MNILTNADKTHEHQATLP